MPKLAAALLLLVTSNAMAVPPLLSQQGRLLNASGDPLEGTLTATFTLWDDPVSGGVLWTESLPLVFDNGYYDVILGATNPIGDGVLDAPAVWMGLELSGEALLPRQRVVSAPYAVRAGVAENVVGGLVDAASLSIDGMPVVDGTGTWVGPAVPGTLATLSCASGDVPAWSGSAWACVAGASFDTTLTEAQVDAYVGNNGYLTSSAADAAYVNEGQAASISTAMLVDNAVTSAKIAADSIVAADIATGGVGSAEIADGTVGTVDLTDSAVTSAKIASDTIAAVDIAAGAVGTSEILDGTIQRSDISGTEVALYQLPSICGGDASSLTLSAASCQTVTCGFCLVGASPYLVYYSCDGSCPGSSTICSTVQNRSPVACSPTRVGYLLAASIP